MVGYRAPVSSTVRWKAGTAIVAVGDLTGDGRGDVLTRAPGATGWQLHKGDGNGHVADAAADGRLRLKKMVSVLSATDWNRDGRADVLGLDRNHGLYLYRSTGKGTYFAGVRIGTGWSRFIATVVPGDLNGDRRPDLLALDRQHVLWRSYSTSTGHLTTPVRVRSLAGYGVLLGGGDLTGDGIGDLLVRRSSDGTAWILPGAGGGAFGYWMGPYAGLRGLSVLSAAPLAGGARPDVLGRVGNQLRVVANNDLTNVRATTSGGLTLGRETTAVLNVGDWNGDRIPDLITRHGTGGDRLLLNRGLGAGRFATGVTMSAGWGTISRLAPVGDITGDGKPDLAGRTAAGVWEVFPGNGATGFLAPRRLPGSLRTFNQLTGTSTARWAPARSGAAVVSADGSFVPVAGSAVAATELRRAGLPTGGYDWIIGPGDVNGDGLADLLARQRSNGTLWLIPGTATGFGQRQFVTGGLGKYRLAG
jgi:hypothetical protein